MEEKTPDSMAHNPEVLEERKAVYERAQKRIRGIVQEELGQDALDFLDKIIIESKDGGHSEMLQDTIAYLLSHVDEGRVTHGLFIQEQRRGVTTGIELVPFRVNKETDQVEVLLLPRTSGDEFWPDEQLHVPGSKWLSGNEEKDLWDRLLNKELKNVEIGKPREVGNLFQRTVRGDENSNIYFVEVFDENPNRGTFYSVDNLPKNTISHHVKIIEVALDGFVEAKFNGE